MHLVANGLAAARGGRIVFSNLSFTVPARHALVLSGANGAGKTTLIRTIAGLLPCSDGTVTLEDGDPERSIGEQCHYIGHANAVRPSLTVGENADFWRRYLSGASATAAGADSVTSALDVLGLARLQHIRAGYLSAGQQRRLGLARLLLSRRSVWLLDEPATSLDTDTRSILDRVIGRHLDDGGLAIVATHIPLALPRQTNLSLGMPAPIA